MTLFGPLFDPFSRCEWYWPFTLTRTHVFGVVQPVWLKGPKRGQKGGQKVVILGPLFDPFSRCEWYWPFTLTRTHVFGVLQPGWLKGPKRGQKGGQKVVILDPFLGPPFDPLFTV